MVVDYTASAMRMIRRWSGIRTERIVTTASSARTVVARNPFDLRFPALHFTAHQIVALWLLPLRIVQVAFGFCERLFKGVVPFGDHHVEPPRTIPVAATCDCLVVGGGPAGLSAAIAASRAGADTMLIERYGCFGGCITTVGMETLGWYRYEGVVEGEGIGLEMERLAARMGGTTKWPFNSSECLDAEYFKVVADELLRAAKVRPLLHTYVVDVIKEGRAIAGIVIENKSGRQAVRAKRVIDCTGDADVAYLAGARCSVPERRDMLGVTTVFSCSGVNKERFLEYTESHPATYKTWSRRGGEWCQQTAEKEEHLRSPFLQEEFERALEDGAIPSNPITRDMCGTWSALSVAGEATNLNLVHQVRVDGCNAFELTHAEMEGRAQTLHALAALRHSVPGFEKSKLRNFGMTLGVRDTRKVVGKYELSSDDVRNQARFEDSIGIFPEFIDGYNILILPTTGRYFQVPLRCMQSPDVDNLLVAGRCVAGDKVSHAAMRNMMACTVTGQGAGVAAAVSIAEGVGTDRVSIRGVQAALKRQGVRLE